MRSVHVTALDGPSGVRVVDVPEPVRGAAEVLIEVHALGMSWPDLLLSRGEYQLKPEVPFQLGVDFAGVVREAPEGVGLAVGDRVAAVLPYGGGADLVSVHPESVFPLPDDLSHCPPARLPCVISDCSSIPRAPSRSAAIPAGRRCLASGRSTGPTSRCRTSRAHRSATTPPDTKSRPMGPVSGWT